MKLGEFVEYLGNPERDVKVPQYAMFTALQRTRPELAARVLIKYMFPEEVLVVSNVHGNSESGTQALDYNKISALRGISWHQMCVSVPVVFCVFYVFDVSMLEQCSATD